MPIELTFSLLSSHGTLTWHVESDPTPQEGVMRTVIFQPLSMVAIHLYSKKHRPPRKADGYFYSLCVVTGGPFAAITTPIKLIHVFTVPEVVLDFTPEPSLLLFLLKPLPLGGGAFLITKILSFPPQCTPSVGLPQTPNKVVTNTEVLKLCVFMLPLGPLSQSLAN